MANLILGVNKYSQSTSCALLNSEGEVLFALARERLTRKKFDGGDIAQLLLREGYELLELLLAQKPAEDDEA